MARQPFNTRWAQGVEAEDSLNSFKVPSDVRLNSGWEGGQDKDAPPAGHENWWHNRVDSALQGVERNGVMAWHSQAVYGLGAPSYGSDGNYYESLVAGNTGNDPTLTTGFWRYAGSSFFTGHEPGDGKLVWHNNIPPAGWLKCNGAILLRASYQRLFAAIGTAHNIGGETGLQFRLPDSRGEFIRGFDDGRGVDAGRVFGSGQGDAIRNITGFLSMTGGFFDGASGAIALSATGDAGTTPQTLNGKTDDFSFDASRMVPTASENRPRNKVANYWIKY